MVWSGAPRASARPFVGSAAPFGGARYQGPIYRPVAAGAPQSRWYAPPAAARPFVAAPVYRAPVYRSAPSSFGGGSHSSSFGGSGHSFFGGGGGGAHFGGGGGHFGGGGGGRGRR
jgi:hypothetical protein